LFAAQVAVREHVPVPLVIVTALPKTEQAPPAAMDGVALELALDETVKVEL
jgi:hypothetical protein